MSMPRQSANYNTNNARGKVVAGSNSGKAEYTRKAASPVSKSTYDRKQSGANAGSLPMQRHMNGGSPKPNRGNSGDLQSKKFAD